MKPRLALLGSALVLGLGLAGCTSPNPILYNLAPVDGQVRQAAPAVIVVEPTAIEPYLERSQIVRTSENYRIDLAQNEWWGEPLSAMVTRVLVTDLGQRLPSSTVISESGAISADADASISVNIRRMDKNAQGQVVLESQAGISFKRGKVTKLRTFRFSETPANATTGAQAAATSAALAQLADALVAMLAEGGR